MLHLGEVLEESMRARAAGETSVNPRWRWLGPLPHVVALETLARCRLLLVTSRNEGGANAVAEAIVCGLPVVATRVDGNVGMLGADHPGLFESGDVDGLARLLLRCERDDRFLAELANRSRRLAVSFAPASERREFRRLIDELFAEERS